ncbi:TIGR04141 family sporadically distributed protein [Microlunatus parietis]
MDQEQIDMLEDFDVDDVTVAGSPGLWVEGSFRTTDGDSAEWCLAASRTTGRPVHFVDSRSAGLLLLIVDKRTYAIGYGQGHRLLSGDQKDRRFGLEFAMRALDPKQVSKLMRRRPGARGRTEVTRMPSGSSIWAFDVSDAYADLVGGAGGKSESLQLTHTRPDRPVPIDGGIGLRIRLATDPAELVSDIRTIAQVLDRARVTDLEFADRMRPLQDIDTVTRLDKDLELMLGNKADEAGHRLSSVVPMELADAIDDVRAYKVRLNGVSRRESEVTVANLLNRAHILRAGTRLQSFRDGRISAYADDDCDHLLGGTKAIEWLEAITNFDDRHFALVDGHWYEIDADYQERLRQAVNELLKIRSDIVLPDWRVDQSERDYNEAAAFDPDLHLICLDRKGVQDEFHTRWGFEACDLLGPGNELIHVKKATGSSPLSHLFMQACVAIQGLEGSVQARSRFREIVRKHGRGRELPPDFKPAKIIFGILLKAGEEITPRTLFPFSQVALVQAARLLQSARIEVEVRSIHLAET